MVNNSLPWVRVVVDKAGKSREHPCGRFVIVHDARRGSEVRYKGKIRISLDSWTGNAFPKKGDIVEANDFCSTEKPRGWRANNIRPINE